jgi:hypothetical protein
MTAVQELQSTGGVLLASGVNAEVGHWGAVARVQDAGIQTSQRNVVNVAKLRVPEFHKMHDHATDAIKMNFMQLRQQGLAQQFDGSMESVSMDDANVVLLQVSVAPYFLYQCKLETQQKPYKGRKRHKRVKGTKIRGQLSATD